jgi:hypothetical protein
MEAPSNPPSPPPDSPAAFSRREILLGGGALGGLLGAWGGYERRRVHRPAVSFLGAGNRLALFAVDGPARLLIARGSDGPALIRALGSVRSRFWSRLDVLILAGNSADEPAHAAALERLEPRQIIALDTGLAAPILQAAGVTPVAESRTIELGSHLSVTLQIGDATAESSRPWHALVQTTEATVVLIPAEVGPLPSLRSAVAFVALDREDQDAGLDLGPQLVAVPSHVDADDLRAAAAAASQPPTWTIRVWPGYAERIAVHNGGFALPAGATAVQRHTG